MQASCNSSSNSGSASRSTGSRPPPRRSPRRWRSSRRPATTAGLAKGWRLLAWTHGTACQFGLAAEAQERALEEARLAGDVRQQSRAATAYAVAAVFGPTSIAEAIERSQEMLAQVSGDRHAEGLLLALPREPARDGGARRGARAPTDAAGRCSRTSGSTSRAPSSRSKRGASRCSPATPWPRSASSAEPTIPCPPSVRGSSSRRQQGSSDRCSTRSAGWTRPSSSASSEGARDGGRRRRAVALALRAVEGRSSKRRARPRRDPRSRGA